MKKLNQKKNLIVDNANGTSTILIHSHKHGRFNVVLDSNYVSIVEEYTWSIAKLRNKFYAVTGIPDPVTGKTKTRYLHSLLNGTPLGLVTDHIDGDTLNN